MDPEKTMEFILEQQAAMSVRQDAIFNMIEAGMKLIAGHDRRIASHDRQIKSIADGLERVVEAQGGLTHAQQITEERLSRLAEAQQATDEKLNRLIDTLQRNASNGRPPA